MTTTGGREDFEEELDEVFELGSDDGFVDLAAHAARRDSDDTPDVIGDFDVLGQVARGGQGIVYRARDRASGADVALKRLPLDASAQARTRFEREMRACVALEHPNIVRVLGIMREDSGAAIAMEWIEGESFVRWARPSGEPPRCIKQTLSAFCGVCRGVEHAHERGILHRDIKPTNILVERSSGRAKLLDFGISKFVRVGPDALDTFADTSGLGTHTSIFVGTLRYAAPEQIEGKADLVDERLDIYSLGVVLYEALTGRAPYDFGAGLADAVQAIAADAPARLSTQTEGARQLDRVLAKCLAKRPRNRYRSVAALRDDLERHLQGKRVSAPRPPSRVRRRAALAALVASGSVGIALAAGALGAFSGADASSPAQECSRFVGQLPRLSVVEASRRSAALEARLRDLPEAGLEADLRLRLGSALHAQGHSELAIAHLQSAQRILSMLNAPRDEQLRCSLTLFDAYLELGALAAARGEAALAARERAAGGLEAQLAARATLCVARHATEMSRPADAQRALNTLPARLPVALEIERDRLRIAIEFSNDGLNPEGLRLTRVVKDRLSQLKPSTTLATTLLALSCRLASDETLPLRERIAHLDDALAHNERLQGRRYRSLATLIARMRQLERAGAIMSARWEALRVTLERRGRADAFTMLPLHRSRQRPPTAVDASEASFEKALAAFREAKLDSPDGMRYLRDAVEADLLRDHTLRLSQRRNEARPARARSDAERALALRRRLVGEEHDSVADGLYVLGRVLANGGGSIEEALKTLRSALDRQLKIRWRRNLSAAKICMRIARIAEATEDSRLREQMLEVAARHEGELRRVNATLRTDLHTAFALLEAERGRVDEAVSRWEIAFATAFGAVPLGGRTDGVHAFFLAQCIELQSRLSEAGAKIAARDIGQRSLAALDASHRGPLPKALARRRRRLRSATSALGR